MSLAYILPNTELVSPPSTLGLGGLRSVDGRVFPLTRVKVRSSVAGPCARTVVEQHFANPFDDVLDVTWIFPLPSEGALVELELRAGEILVKGECQERSQARATFNAAVAQGKRTALVEKEQGDVHTLSLAGLPARSEVTVRLTLVELLPAIDGRFRWQFPTTIAPRYTPGQPTGHSGLGISADTDVVPNASRLTPPLRIEGGTELDLEVEIAGPLSTIESSLHAVKLSLDSGSVRVAPSAQPTMNKDFILEFSTANSATPVTRAWTDGTHSLVLLEPPADTSAEGLPRDAVFIVDISGSMEGVKMRAAKTALHGALHGLHTGDRFKLLAFDDRVERFSDDFSAYNDRNIAAADAWIDRLNARGGTEMLAAIQESLSGSTPEGRLRTVLLITDGQSNDESRLLPAVANRRGEAVFFTLGIDIAVNAALLKSLARAGGGVCELCTPSDNIDAVVARLEARFGSPRLSNIKVAGAARPDGQVVFAGRPAHLLIDSAPSSIEITGTGVDGAFTKTVSPAPLAFPLGSLWAMERIAWLDERLTLRPFEEEAIRPEILRVALQWHISSRFTAFVCVDHTVVNTGNRRHVVQPAELPDAWALQQEIAEMSTTMGHAVPMAAPPMPQQAFASMPAPPQRSQSRYAAPLPSSPMMHSPDQDSAGGGGGGFGAVFEAMISPFKKSRSPKLSAAKSAELAAPVDVAGELARTQLADGSFGDDVGRTVAALLALLLLGNTRRKGDRRRTVRKAAEWLKGYGDDSRAVMAFAALATAETSGVAPSAAWRTLVGEGHEGAALATLLLSRGI